LSRRLKIFGVEIGVCAKYQNSGTRGIAESVPLLLRTVRAQIACQLRPSVAIMCLIPVAGFPTVHVANMSRYPRATVGLAVASVG